MFFYGRLFATLRASVVIVVAVVFVYFGFKVYGSFSENNDLKRVESQMSKIREVVEVIFNEGGETCCFQSD